MGPLYRCIAAIESGGSVRALVRRLAELETARTAILKEKTEIEIHLEAAQIQRPNTDAVRRVWGRFGELWEEGTADEQEALLQRMITRVEMSKKTKGACEIIVKSQAPAGKLEPTPCLGAGVRLELTTFGL